MACPAAARVLMTLVGTVSIRCGFVLPSSEFLVDVRDRESLCLGILLDNARNEVAEDLEEGRGVSLECLLDLWVHPDYSSCALDPDVESSEAKLVGGSERRVNRFSTET